MTNNKSNVQIKGHAARVIKHHLQENPEGAPELDLYGTFLERATTYESGQRVNHADMQRLYEEFSNALDMLVHSDEIYGWHDQVDGDLSTVYQLSEYHDIDPMNVESPSDEIIGTETPPGYTETGIPQPEDAKREELVEAGGIPAENGTLFEDEKSRTTQWEE